MNYEEKDSKLHVAKEPDFSYDKHYTYADYLNLPFDYMVEIIKGKIFSMRQSPPPWHQTIRLNFLWVLNKEVESRNWEMFHNTLDVVLQKNGKDFMKAENVVQPDVMIICDRNKIQERGCFGSPDWIIEVLSPLTIKKDLKLKYLIYQEFGVKEYWIVEPLNKTVEVFVLENDQYKRIQTYVDDDHVPCNTLKGFSIDLKEIFEDLTRYQ